MRKYILVSFTLAIGMLAVGTGFFIAKAAPKQTCVPSYPPLVQHGPRNIPKVALTFDDWGSRENFETILRILRKKNVKAAFFVLGYGIRRHPEFVQMLVTDGHLIGNHTYSHIPLARFDSLRVRNEVLWTHRQLVKLGVNEHPYFRYPFGSHNAKTDALIEKLGYSLFFWDVNSGGTGYPAERVRYRVVSWSKPGSIILMHINSQADITALPHIIDGLRSRGLEPVRIDELFMTC